MSRIALVLFACLIAGIGLARAAPVSENDFWLLVERTDQALAQPQPSLEALRQQWAAVDSVLIDETPITLDLAWIRDALASDSADQHQQLERYLGALLDYHQQQILRPGDGGASLPALDKVLSDPRFQYGQIEPTPLPTTTPDQPRPAESNVSPAGSLPSQLIMIALGVIAVVLVLTYVARAINVQSAELKAASSEDDPTNFAEARERAETYEAARNYRAAIRYLYLSSLLLLDEHNLIRYDPSLTNHEHLRQIAAKPQLFDALRQVINTFEDVWYGFRPVDDAVYQAYRRHIDQLRQLIS